MLIESTPVSGVETKKEVVAGFEAPACRKPKAAGITPQEHNGNGTPIKAALKIDPSPGLVRCRCKNACGIRLLNKPPINKPNNNQGAASNTKSSKAIR